MRKIGLFNIGKLGLVKSAGTGKTDINKVIEKWIPKHMVFWYDMAKPVDVYIPGVTYANQFINDGGKIKYDSTINKCTITHTPTSANKNFWQVSCSPSSAVSSFKIRVTGLPQGFSIESGIYSTKITSDGEYDIPEYKNSGTATRYPGFYLAGDNVNDADCNIVVEEIPTRQSVPTNEILKSNPYLQDFSGNNRPLKLNNFLFSAMSGVGGYTLNAKSYHNRSNSIVGTFGDYSIEITAKVTDILGIVWTKNGVGDSNSVAVGETLTRPAFTITVEGMPDDLKWGMYESGDADKGNGTFEIPAYTYTNNTETVQTKFVGLTFSQSTFDNVDIKFTFQPLYPNALVTDGVDDYGEVQNFVALQNYMMFYQCAVIKPTGTAKGMFSTVSGSNNNNGWLLLQNQGKNTSRFGNGTYMDVQLPNDSEVKTDYILTGNGNKMTLYVGDETQILNGTYTSTGNTMGFFLSDYKSFTRYGSLAFYKSILFDAVPAKETDGFTEQDLIDYYIPKSIVTITVVDVNGAPIQDATVTVEGIQYKTLSDGTVKVWGMANGTMSLSVKKDGYMPFSDNSWKLADSRITLEVLRNTVITENGYSILLENDGLILTE